MTSSLLAKHCTAQIDDDINVILVAFADDEVEPQEYILLQRSIECEDGDKELGFDKVHITHNNESQSIYGGIQRFVLNKHSVEMVLDENTADAIGTDTKIEILLDQSIQENPAVKQILQQMFVDEPHVFTSNI